MGIASWSGHERVVRALAELGADVNQTDDEGRTPVYIASRNGHEQAVRAMAELVPM